MVVGNDHVGFSARLTWRLFQDKDLLVWTFLEHHQGTIGPTFPPLQGVFSIQKIDPKRGPGRCCYQLGKLVFGIPVHILAEW